jgi:GntR family transcriptional regulator / MocR family aminotransferase
MPSSRATSGVDVTVGLSDRKLRLGLEHELREAVRGGRLQPGARLPSSRTFAKELGVGRNTVADAFAQLVAEGWLVARHGAGTWVADRPDRAAAEVPASRGDDRAVRFDLRPGAPDLSAFPRSQWLAAARRALAVASDRSLGYGDPRGVPELRVALAGYLARARRVAVDPGRIIVCAGFAQGLELVGVRLRRRGATTVAVEAFGHRLHREIIENCGLAVRPVTVDDRGARVDQCGDAAAVLLTPAHQFPLGVVLDPVRRRHAIRWAAQTGALVLEDDYDGEFRYDRQAVGAMQSLGPDQVVYAGTASKSLAPGLRLGWLVVPSALVDELVEIKRSKGAFPSTFDQLTLAEFIAGGAYDRHIRRARLAYRRRRDRLVETLAGQVPAVGVSGIAAGLHVVAHVPDRPEDELIGSAAEHGVAGEGLGNFTQQGHGRPPALVVGYATPPDHAYTAALARLVAALGSATAGGAESTPASSARRSAHRRASPPDRGARDRQRRPTAPRASPPSRT